VGGRVFEPGEEVERLSQVAAVVETAGDRGEVLEPRGDVPGTLFEDRSSLVLAERPPLRRLPDRDERGCRRRRTAEWRLTLQKRLLLGSRSAHCS